MKSPEYRTSAAQWDGAMPVVINSPQMSFISSAAVDNQGTFVAPCDLDITEALLRVLATTGSSLALLNIGKQGAAASFLADYSIDAVAAGLHTIAASAFATRRISRGDAVDFQLEQATAAGTIAVSLVCMPAA